MRDGNTLCFDIKYPWYETRPWPKGCKKWEDVPAHKKHKYKEYLRTGWRESFVMIWHRDPPAGECEWFRMKLSNEERKLLDHEIKFEIKYWFNYDGKFFTPKVSAEAIVIQAFQTIAWRLWRREIKAKYLSQVLSLTYNHMDNFADGFRKVERGDDIIRSCYFIAQTIKRMHRPWWKHPRWHFWHWNVVVCPVQKFKRWAFTRCIKCGRRFKWGETCISNQWESSGPRWFRSESVYHTWHDGTSVGVETRAPEVPTLPGGAA